MPQGGLRFADAIFQPIRLTETGTDAVIRGLMATGAKLPQRLTPAITENMFRKIVRVMKSATIERACREYRSMLD